jgi:hypothetical protein
MRLPVHIEYWARPSQLSDEQRGLQDVSERSRLADQTQHGSAKLHLQQSGVVTAATIATTGRERVEESGVLDVCMPPISIWLAAV